MHRQQHQRKSQRRAAHARTVRVQSGVVEVNSVLGGEQSAPTMREDAHSGIRKALLVVVVLLLAMTAVSFAYHKAAGHGSHVHAIFHGDDNLEYRITYNTDEGAFACQVPEGYSRNSESFYLPIPVKTGYVFLGWFKNARCSGDPVRMITSKDRGNVELYAAWISADEPNDKIVFKFCQAQGLSAAAAAAVVGNAMQESGCDPNNAVGEYCGMFAWTGEPLVQLNDIAAQQGSGWNDLQCQLTLIIRELSDDSETGTFAQYTGWSQAYDAGIGDGVYGWPDKVTFDQWRTWDDVSLATQCFEQVFERAGTPAMDQRIAYAQAAYDSYA